MCSIEYVGIDIDKNVSSERTANNITTLPLACWYISSLEKKLQVTVRFIKNMEPRTSIKRTELSNLGFLNVENRVKHLCLNHVHKIFNNACPSYLKNISLKNNEYHKQE
jgi:hypothetical protein